MSQSFPNKEIPLIKELAIWLLIATGLIFAFIGFSLGLINMHVVSECQNCEVNKEDWQNNKIDVCCVRSYPCKGKTPNQQGCKKTYTGYQCSPETRFGIVII